MTTMKDNYEGRSNVSLYIMDDDTGEVLRQKSLKRVDQEPEEIHSSLVSKKKLKVYSHKTKTKLGKFITEEYISTWENYKYKNDMILKLTQCSPNVVRLLCVLSSNVNKLTNIVKKNHKSYINTWTDLYYLLNIRDNRFLRNDFLKFVKENNLLRAVQYMDDNKKKLLFILNPIFFKCSKFIHIYTVYVYMDLIKQHGILEQDSMRYIKKRIERIRYAGDGLSISIHNSLDSNTETLLDNKEKEDYIEKKNAIY